MEFEKIPHEYNLHGRIVKFNDPLIIYEEYPREKTENGIMMRCDPNFDKVLFEAPYLLVQGGFGEVSYTSGRMLIGVFGKTPEDCLKGQAEREKHKDDPLYINQSETFSSGNTKLFPDFQSKEKFL